MNAEKEQQQLPAVIFIRVLDNASKTMHICKSIQHHFDQGEKILITVANDEAATYVDLLLWRLPEESFLPHLVSQQPSYEHVVITTVKENLNKATVLLNLCQEASPIGSQFKTIYELYDETHPDKLKLSKQRKQSYQSQGFSVQ